jgi:hypoxanthine phosphoribosyltransferase
VTVEAAGEVGTTICTAAEIGKAIERLAAKIAFDYRRQPLFLLAVLKGAVCFSADLARALARQESGPSEIIMDYVVVQRYGSLGSSGGKARLGMDFSISVSGAHVLILDDIVDNGRTLEFIASLLRERRPASLRSCALFDRRARREVEVPVDYVGMAIPNVFAIGYGLDYKELYRNLPYLAELQEGKTV